MQIRNSERSKGAARLIAALVCLAAFATTASAQEVESLLSMTMKDADLADVMDIISREERVNIFVSTDSAETVSFSLYDMALPDAVRAIANAAGMAVEHSDGNYFIVDRDEAGKYSPDALTRVAAFELHYVSVEEVESLLLPYLSEYGEMTVFNDRDIVLVEDTPAFLRRVEALIDRIDVPPTQILIEAKILEVTLTDEDLYGLEWSKLFSSDGGGGSFGTQGLTNPGSSGLFFNYATADITATLNALSSQGRVRTLSTPKLLAAEGQEASVIIGDRRGYSVTTTINQVTTETIEFLESGVILRVTPTVDDEGKILMDVHPEVSTGVIDPLTGIPSQATTEVTTQMLVPNGQTIFVGGLIQHRVEESKQGVPLLGRIPGVGLLFSNRQNNKNNRETIVMITPRIVTASTPTYDQEDLDRIIDFDAEQRDRNSKINSEMQFFFVPGGSESSATD